MNKLTNVSNMMSCNHHKPFAWLLLMLYMLCGFSLDAIADTKVGEFSMIRGNVDALQEELAAPISAVVGMGSYLGSTVRTKGRSRTKIVFLDGSVLNMGPNHMMKIKDFVYDEEKGIRRTLITVLRGSVRATVAKMGGDADSIFKIETPTAVIAVRGTDFFVNVDGNGTTVTLNRGAVDLTSINPNVPGIVKLQPGQQSHVSKGQAPTPAVKVPAKLMKAMIKASTKKATTKAAPKKAVAKKTTTKKSAAKKTTTKTATKSSTSNSTSQSSASNQSSSTASSSTSTQNSGATTASTTASNNTTTASSGASAGTTPSLPAAPAPVNLLLPVVPVTVPTVVVPATAQASQGAGSTAAAQPPVQVQVPITNIVPALQTTPVNVNIVF